MAEHALLARTQGPGAGFNFGFLLGACMHWRRMHSKERVLSWESGLALMGVLPHAKRWTFEISGFEMPDLAVVGRRTRLDRKLALRSKVQLSTTHEKPPQTSHINPHQKKQDMSFSVAGS